MNYDSTSNEENLHQEILLSTDINSQLANIYVWDYDSGSNLLAYNNCSTIKNGLGFIKQDYMLCAINQKPFIFCWNLKNRNQQYTKITTAGVINSIAISNCGNYIAVGIAEKCFIWQTYTGKVLSTLSRHFQTITKILFSSNDQYLITASEDSIIIVWDFHDVLTKTSEYVNPAFKLNSHSLAINDIYISKTTERLISISVDQNCKLWNLLNGSVISSVLFNYVPTAVLFDNLENNVYIAFINGSIGHLSIKSLLNETNNILNETQYGTFIGHKQKINCLAISFDDSTLASGSDDLTIRIWDTFSRQCVKILNQSGPVTNLQFRLGTNFFNADKSLIAPLPTRFNADTEYNTENTITKLIKEDNNHQKLQLSDFLNNYELNDNHDEYFELKNKFDNVRKINEKIYNFTLNEILK